MELFNTINGAVNDFVWGVPAIILIMGVGLYLTIRLKGVQFRNWGFLIKNTYVKAFSTAKEEDAAEKKEGEITSFQAAMASVSAVVGSGNIAGVATAIVAGGPGALFWMIVAAIVGMATKFAEIARVRAELDELNRYEDEVKTEIERHIRDVINNAIADYFSIEKNYKAMAAARENYFEVKRRYLRNESTIAQLIDAQKIYLDSKVAALNSQAEFLKQLVWLQRGICAVNWTKATPEAKQFIEKVKTDIKKNGDITLL